MSLLSFYVAGDRTLLQDNVSDEELESNVRQRWASIVLNIVAIAVAVVLPLAAVGLYLITSFVALLMPLITLRRQRR